MGLWDEIEAAKNKKLNIRQNEGTEGTTTSKSVLTIRKNIKKCGSITGDIEVPHIAPEGYPGAFIKKLSNDSSDSFITASEVLKKYKVKYLYINNAKLAKKAVKELMAVETIFGIDIETAKHADYKNHDKAGLEPSLSKIRLIQLYAGKDTVFVFDMNSCKMKSLSPLLKSKDFVAHNAIFEMKHLMYAGVDVHNFECTMLMGNALRGKHHKLRYLVKTCLKITISKELQISNWNLKTLTDDQIAYAACDAVLVYQLYVFLNRLISVHDRNKIYSLMYKAQKAVAQLELNGIYFDTEAHEELISQWKNKLEEAHTVLRNQVGNTLNLNSGKQISDWLRKNLDEGDLKKLPHTKTGQIKTTIDALSIISHHPLIEPLKDYKKYKKLISSFGTSYSKYVNPVTKRLHGDFTLAGTSTGRFACFKPNIQNPPRDKAFRSLFKAPQGYMIIVADYGQMQLRIAALLSQDKKMLKAYKEGVDLHKMTAAAIAGVNLEDVTKEQRQMAKAINFGFIFGQGAKSFKAKTEADYGISMTDNEAKKSRNAFFYHYLGLKQWQKTTARRAQHDKSVTTPGGRLRDFSLERKGYLYTEALNTPVQGAEAEVVLAVLSLLGKYMKGINAKLVNIIHDEFVFEVAQKDKDKALAAVEKVMIAGMLQIFPEASTLNLVDAHAGDNWADAK